MIKLKELSIQSDSIPAGDASTMGALAQSFYDGLAEIIKARQRQQLLDGEDVTAGNIDTQQINMDIHPLRSSLEKKTA